MSLVVGNKLAELLVLRDKDSALPASFPYVTLSDDPEDPTRLHAIRLQSTLPLTASTTWSLTDPTQRTVSPRPIINESSISLLTPTASPH